MNKGICVSLSLGLLLVMCSVASAQINCTASAGSPPILRSDGLSEPVGDYLLTCSGGTPTPAGSVVPQINLTLFLNTVITSKITEADASGTYSEVLALVDEPNTGPSGPPVLNCAQTGAPDNSPSGPTVCAIISTGNPTQTYDGTAQGYGTATCDGVGADPPPNSFGCGRPNAFQGRVLPGGQNNAITFVGIPFDPPGLGTRTIRIKNLRANAYFLGVSPGPSPTEIIATIAVGDPGVPLSFNITAPQQVVAFSVPGLLPGGCGTPAASTVRLCEGFAASWKTKNLSFYVGDNLATPGNGTPQGGFYEFAGTTHYPADIAQNVPPVVYNTESMFEWRNASPNGPPSVNPPAGFSPTTVPNLGYPLGSAGLGFSNTHPELAGVATAATRVAVQFTGVPPGASIQVPQTIALFRNGCSPCNVSGALLLTTADPAGGGAYSAALTGTLGPNNLAVYEVLFADVFSVEYGDVSFTVVGGSSAGVSGSATFAPFYTDAASGQPSATAFLPRFAESAPVSAGNLISTINGMGLPKGTSNSLNAKLNTVLADIAAGNKAGACQALTDLISQATAESGKKLTVAQANQIINQALTLKGQLGC